MKKTRVLLACVAVISITAPARADLISIEYEIQNGRNNDTMYSLFHKSNREQNGGGQILWDLGGTFRATWDTDLRTLTVTDFDGQILKRNRDHALGSVSLNTSHPDALNTLSVDENGIIGGNITLDLALEGRSKGFSGTDTLRWTFEQVQYTSIMNTFDDETYTVGLWGVGHSLLNDDGKVLGKSLPYGMGMDLLGAAVSVPAPGPAALCLVAAVCARRPRRRTA